MKFHRDVLAAHAQFGGDLEGMQRRYDASVGNSGEALAWQNIATLSNPEAPASLSKRYCQCANSKTNPCIVCGKPKFIDPEWLKRKIEEDGDEGEIGAGFELFPLPEAPAAPVGEP
ncbi:hypothetical protein NKH48_13720 [Mesorhizobium sp. M1233]|uniref:hypothetical protein n=1 Tax=Mesorhizobium sp. M1233 TaxID=2957072 RepID=UPI0033374C9A